MFICLLTFGGLAVITGIIGIILSLRSNTALITVFGVLALLISAGFITLGTIMVLFNQNGKVFLEDYCDREDVDATNALADIAADMNAITKLTNRYMCTTDCPCPASAEEFHTTTPDRNWSGDNSYDSFKKCYAHLQSQAQYEVRTIEPSILDMYE